MNIKRLRYFFLISLMVAACCLIFASPAKTQLWQAMPPYNVLWPLFSPALSSVNPYTGLTTPNISYLDTYTNLPQEPSFVWDTNLPYFYTLYNDPSGRVVYYDPIGLLNGTTLSGFSYWPPSAYITPWGTPDPITLPLNYRNLISFDPTFALEYWVPITNQAWATTWGYYPWYFLSAANLLPVTGTYYGYYFY